MSACACMSRCYCMIANVRLFVSQFNVQMLCMHACVCDVYLYVSCVQDFFVDHHVGSFCKEEREPEPDMCPSDGGATDGLVEVVEVVPSRSGKVHQYLTAHAHILICMHACLRPNM